MDGRGGALVIALLFLGLLKTRAGSPAEAVVLAAADATRTPNVKTLGYRYLWLGGIPEPRRKDFLKVLAFHVNSLSREAYIANPSLVAPDLVRISLLDYEMDGKVWEKFKDVDPYFHALIQEDKVEVVTEVVEVDVPYGYWKLNTSGEIVTDEAWIKANKTKVFWETTKTVKEKKTVKREKKVPRTFVSAAPWLPPKEMAALVEACATEVPILRADWFVYWTAIQKGRQGVGYYDMLGLKKREDAEKLAALDVAAAKRVRKEIAALVAESGVAINNRQIVRYQSLTGGYWFTLDANESTGKSTALSLLDGDFKHDAEEIYAVLPNSLFFLVASNANGELQETVPDSIAFDHASTSNDRRIHPGLSCVRCHSEGLRAIDDWARETFQGPENPGSPVKLSSIDPRKLKRLQQLYLTPLKRQLEKDREVYAEALLAVNGLTPAENSRLYAQAWRDYAELSLTLADAARELCTTRLRLEAALKGYGAVERSGPADPVVLSLLVGRRVRREHFDERHALFQQILAQYGGK